MNELSMGGFERAIRKTHNAASKFLIRARVVEEFKGETAWTGEVLVFVLLDHLTATRCYCWEVDGRVTAVLHEPPVDSPAAAVRAAIAAEHLERNRETK